MDVRTYLLEDGRTICVCVEEDQWSAWLADDVQSQVVGFPLEGVLMEVVGLKPAHDDIPSSIAALADRVRADVSR